MRKVLYKYWLRPQHPYISIFDYMHTFVTNVNYVCLQMTTKYVLHL